MDGYKLGEKVVHKMVRFGILSNYPLTGVRGLRIYEQIIVLFYYDFV